MTGGFSARNGQTWAIACWFEHSMRWVLITPFGMPVEPEVNRYLHTVSGRMAAKAVASAGPGRVWVSLANGVAPPSRFTLLTTSAPPRSTLPKAAAKRWPSAAKTIPALSMPRMWRSLPKSFDISE